MHKHGGDIYSNQNMLDFSANINPLGTPVHVLKAGKKAVEQSIFYPDTEKRGLKKAIARREGVGAEHIICANGAAELIFALCFARQPRKALVAVPSFEEYRLALECIDCEIVDYQLCETQGFQPGESLLQLLDDTLDMVFLCNPNNPTGVLYPRELLEQAAKICKRNKTLLVLDECFMDFLTDKNGFMGDGVFHLRAFTKMYAMAGVRLGYGICFDENLMEKIHRVLQPWNVSCVAQAMGIAVAEDISFQEETRQLIAEEKTYLLCELESLVEKIYGWSANFIFFQDSKDLFGELYARGIMIRDCSNFTGLGSGFYRIAVKSRQDNEKLIRALKEVRYGKINYDSRDNE